MIIINILSHFQINYKTTEIKRFKYVMDTLQTIFVGMSNAHNFDDVEPVIKELKTTSLRYFQPK